MENARNFYIDGRWVGPADGRAFDVIDPSTEEAAAQISLGGQADTDAAVAAAKAAFPKWRLSSKAERLDLLESILAVYARRSDEIGAAISLEMGAPIDMSKVQQSGTGS
ncbi:MAG: aldehyde dehydrogenase family protein, partial [Pseudomonadota bacterium]